jgi:hypothetical protein
VSGDGVVVSIFNSTTPALNRLLLRRILIRATPPVQEGILKIEDVNCQYNLKIIVAVPQKK